MSWASVALTSGDQYTITASPTSTNTELQTLHAVKLVIKAPTTPTDYTGVQSV